MDNTYRDYAPGTGPICGVISCLAIELFIGALVWASYFVVKGFFQ